MTADLSPVLPRLVLLLPRLASDQDGEIVATVRAIGRVLHGADLDWHDLAAALYVGPLTSAPTVPAARRATPAWTPPAPPGASSPRTLREMAKSVAWHGAVKLAGKDAMFAMRLARQLRTRAATPKEEARIRALFVKLGGAQ